MGKADSDLKNPSVVQGDERGTDKEKEENNGCL